MDAQALATSLRRPKPHLEVRDRGTFASALGAATVDSAAISSSYRGLYFGSCKFADINTADYLLANNQAVRWIAGYARKVPWIESTACDMMFFQLLLGGRFWATPKKSGHKACGTPRQAAQALYEVFPLAAKMEFALFDRTPHTGMTRSTLADR